MIVAQSAARGTASEVRPARVGRYDLLVELGRGGMASVSLARSIGSGGFERLAAVKLLHSGLCADPEFVEMFLDEARLAARLHHPNTAAIIDLGAEGTQLYMVMDYVEGDTLHAVQCGASARHQPLPLGVALRIVLDVLAGLDAAHELKSADGAPLGMIHRDVTPQNVLVGVDGVARLVDFGIARAACRTAVTSVGVLKGRLAFMAPEQLRGQLIDRRADVFSLGVTLWETLTLRRCLPNREGALKSRFAEEVYHSLRDFVPHLPAALDELCRRALAPDPADRIPTAAAFAEALEAEFRADLATQRELGQFMAVIAADKLRVEREAVRASSQPLPGRTKSRAPAAVTSRPAARGIDLRPPRAPEQHAPRSRAPLSDSLVGAEAVTSLGRLPAAPPRHSHTRVHLPPLPERRAEVPAFVEVDICDLPQVTRATPVAAHEPCPATPSLGEPELRTLRVAPVAISPGDAMVLLARRTRPASVEAPAGEPAPSQPVTSEAAVRKPTRFETAYAARFPSLVPSRPARSGSLLARLWSRLFG
jgi:serine/threonine protein kinase